MIASLLSSSIRLGASRFTVRGLAAFLGLAAAARADLDLPAYEPHPVEVPRGASYVQPDGSIRIVGVDGLAEAFVKWNALFVQTHPGFKFKMDLYGSSTGIYGLTAGVSAFGPMGRSAWPGALGGFGEEYGYKPLDIHIGYGGYGPRPKYKNPPAIYVSAKNHLAGLTLEQVARIFTSGSPKGSITHWNQLGGKDAPKRGIHVYGPPDDGAFATATRINFFKKNPFVQGYESLASNAEIAKALAVDPYGIGLISYLDPVKAPGIKLVPLAAKAGEPFADPSYDNVHGGKYPFSDALHVYVNRAPGKPLDPFVKEYLRMMLSREGQAIIAEEKDKESGYVPLNPADIPKELAKLE